MTSIRNLTLEMHMVKATEDAASAYRAAAAAPWWSPRRWLQTRAAIVYDREARMWEEQLFAEARAAEHRLYPRGGASR